MPRESQVTPGTGGSLCTGHCCCLWAFSHLTELARLVCSHGLGALVNGKHLRHKQVLPQQRLPQPPCAIATATRRSPSPPPVATYAG